MIWYPYQQMKTMKEPYKIIDAQGVWLKTPEREMIDSISSWWSVIHGYKHPALTEAIKVQADAFSHVMLGGLTHEPEFSAGGSGLLLFLRFRKCCCGSGAENGSAILC